MLKIIDFTYNDADTFLERKYSLALELRNKYPQIAAKVGEPASGIPSQALDNREGVTT